MTPLIDVCLVLVIVLLVSTPMAFQSSIAVQRAASGPERRSRRSRSGGDHPRLARGRRREPEPDPRSSLAGLLKPLLEASATKLVVVRCGQGITHGAFVSVLDEAKACGAAQIAVVGG
jgi:biopolymer transport protein ExbD